MPTILTHPIPMIAVTVGLGLRVVPIRLALAALLFALLPDIDGIGFFLGIPYDSLWGHRGLSHSLAAALLAGVIGFLIAPALHAGRLVSASILCFAVLSHIALDAMTDGGLGVAFFSPFDQSRYFLPWRPIRVSPIAPAAFFSKRGLGVMISEWTWVWLPMAGLALVSFLVRRRISITSDDSTGNQNFPIPRSVWKTSDTIE